VAEIVVDNLNELKQVLEKYTIHHAVDETKKSTNGLMVSDEQKIQEQLGDLEYELHFKELLDESPLFKLGFDPKNIYYQRESNIPKGLYTTKSATYYPSERTLEYFEERAINQERGAIGRNVHREAAQAIQRKEIPEGDFIFMRSFMLPGDKTTDYPLGTEGISGLDKPDELSTHMHEFMHRALNTVPQLKEWKENNIAKISSDILHPSVLESGNTSYIAEEVLMGAFVAKYFPQMAEYERDRISSVYGVDIDSKKKQLNKWIDEIETVSKDILKSKGVPEKVEQKKSIMIKPKIKPKPIPKKSFIQMLKSLFTGE